MNPALDLNGFRRRTVMPPDDVNLVESKAPGFTVGQLAIALSKIYSRLGKRYACPFGQSAPLLGATGTTPPPVTLTGVPAIGSMTTLLSIVLAGALGASAFVWSSDGGSTWTLGPAMASAGTSPPAVGLSGASTVSVPALVVLGVTTAGALGASRFQWSQDGGVTWSISSLLAASGTTPPAVTVSGSSSLALPSRLVLQITGAGGVGIATFRWSLDGGATFTSSVTAGTVALQGTGLVASFTPGAYATDNVYTGQGIPTAASVPLGATGLVAAFASGTYALDNAYAGQGTTTGATVKLGATGMVANFPAGAYALDNAYQAPPAVPEVVLGWLTTIVTPDLYRKRGVNPADPQLALVEESRKEAWLEVKEAADSKDGLFELPTNDALEDAAVTKAGPLGYSETSPYVWTDVQEATAQQEDANAGGTSQ